MEEYDESRPLCWMTLGEFRKFLDGYTEGLRKDRKTDSPTRRYVYGLRGISELFGVSLRTAQIYKETVIRDAVMQNRRKIVTDVDKALELFRGKRDGI